MIIMTDVPQWVQGLPMCRQGCAGEWIGISDGLDPIQRELWRRLGGRQRLWRGRVEAENLSHFWDILLVVDEAAESQFDVLKDLGAAHQEWPANVACLALTGRDFHGHRDRSWHTARGNLHLCTACHLGVDARSCGLSLTALPAVAVTDALAEHGDWATAPGIKWVNDILMAGRKVGGVLTATQSLRQTITSLTMGIGLNVGLVPPGFAPDLFVPAAGCLADLARGPAAPTVGEILERLLRHLARRLAQIRTAGPEPLLADYRRHNLALGRKVIVLEDLPGPESGPGLLAEGLVTGIGSDLTLILEGRRNPLARGRLIFCEPPQGAINPDGETNS